MLMSFIEHFHEIVECGVKTVLCINLSAEFSQELLRKCSLAGVSCHLNLNVVHIAFTNVFFHYVWECFSWYWLFTLSLNVAFLDQSNHFTQQLFHVVPGLDFSHFRTQIPLTTHSQYLIFTQHNTFSFSQIHAVCSNQCWESYYEK